MIAIAIGIILLVVAWTIRQAFYQQADVWKEKVELVAKESSADLQEDYKDLHDKVVDIKAKHNNKWYKMSDIEEVMK